MNDGCSLKLCARGAVNRVMWCNVNWYFLMELSRKGHVCGAANSVQWRHLAKNWQFLLYILCIYLLLVYLLKWWWTKHTTRSISHEFQVSSSSEVSVESEEVPQIASLGRCCPRVCPENPDSFIHVLRVANSVAEYEGCKPWDRQLADVFFPGPFSISLQIHTWELNRPPPCPLIHSDYPLSQIVL